MCLCRAILRLPVEDHTLVAGSYNLAPFRAWPLPTPQPRIYPPAIRTLPLGNRVAVCHRPHGQCIEAHTPVAGSYNSAVVR